MLLEEKKSIKGIKGILSNDDFLKITTHKDNGRQKQRVENHDGEEWLSFSENFAIDLGRAKDYYMAHRNEIDKRLDSIKSEILESCEATKSEKLMGYTTFNAVSMYWNIDIHWVTLYFVREHIRNPKTISFNVDRLGNLIYVKI